MKQRTRQDPDFYEVGRSTGTENRASRRPTFRFAMAQYVRGSGIKRRRRKLGKNGFTPRRMSSKL